MRTYFLEPPLLWRVFYFALGNSRQNKTSSLENPRNWAIPEKKKKQQSFPNSSKGLEGAGQKFYLGRFFYWVKETWGVILTIQIFFKAKNSFL